MAIELNRIGWEDAPSEQTPLDSGNLKQMENNTEDAINEAISQIESKMNNIISVSFNNNYSMSSSNWQQVELVFDKIVGQIGNLLKLENGKIKIGKGIKKVKASFQTSTKALANDTFYSVNIKINGNSVASNEGKKVSDPQNWSFVIAPVLIDVEENDEISVSLFCNSATLMSGMTQFVVEVIEWQDS